MIIIESIESKENKIKWQVEDVSRETFLVSHRYSKEKFAEAGVTPLNSEYIAPSRVGENVPCRSIGEKGTLW